MTERLQTKEIPSRDGLADRILELGLDVTQKEKEMSNLADLLENAYGVTVEDILQERENQNGATK